MLRRVAPLAKKSTPQEYMEFDRRTDMPSDQDEGRYGG